MVQAERQRVRTERQRFQAERLFLRTEWHPNEAERRWLQTGQRQSRAKRRPRRGERRPRGAEQRPNATERLIIRDLRKSLVRLPKSWLPASKTTKLLARTGPTGGKSRTVPL